MAVICKASLLSKGHKNEAGTQCLCPFHKFPNIGILAGVREKSIIHVRQYGSRYFLFGPDREIEHDLETIVPEAGKLLFNTAGQIGMNNLMLQNELSVLPVEGKLRHNTLNFLLVDPIVSVQIHLEHGGISLTHMQVRYINLLFLQLVDHTLSIPVCAHHTHHGGFNTKPAQVNDKIYAVACRVCLIQIVIHIHAVETNPCHLHAASSPP
ncbi:hypothetical protein D3C76_1237520 [compost metagenome]